MPLDAKTTSLDPASALSPRLDHQRLDRDDLIGGLVPVVGAHHQQHRPRRGRASARLPQRHPRRSRPPPSPARDAPRNRAPMTCWEWSGSQSHSVCKAYSPGASSAAQNLRAVSRSPRRVVRDVEVLRPLDRFEPRPVRPAAVQQQCVSVRILHVGGARRRVEPVRRSAVFAEPFAHGGPAQSAVRSRVEAARETSGGPTGTGTRPSPSSSAMTLPCRPWEAGKAPGRQRGGVHPGRRREDRAVVWGTSAPFVASSVQSRSERFIHEVAAQSIDHDENCAALSRHGLASDGG